MFSCESMQKKLTNSNYEINNQNIISRYQCKQIILWALSKCFKSDQFLKRKDSAFISS